MEERELHPAAVLFPPMAGKEFDDLIKDIRRHGLREPIKLYEGKILDGRNRYRACAEEGVEPSFIDLPENLNPWDYVWSENAERRHLEKGTKAVIRIRQLQVSEAWQKEQDKRREEANHKRSEAMEGKPYASKGGTRESSTSNDVAPSPAEEPPKGRTNVTDAQVAQVAGTSEATAARAKALVEKRSDLADKVQANEITLNEACHQMKKDQVAKNIGELPPGKYRVIYADPPWKYSDELIEGYGAAEHHYPAMTISELCALDVKSRAADDAVLFLWVTSPMFGEWQNVVSAWGFTYKASFIWDKIKHNYGHYNSVRHEILLICTRGSCTPDTNKLFDSVISIEREEHSKKPKEFRAMIDTLYRGGEKGKMELFAREKVEGWTPYGNEL